MKDIDKLAHSTVKQAIAALQRGDQAAWIALFATEATLYHEGAPRNLRVFTLEVVGAGRFAEVERIENNGLHVYGLFYSVRWGDIRTYFKFVVDGTSKISRLDVGHV